MMRISSEIVFVPPTRSISLSCKTFNNRTWLAGSLGYGIGARGTINEDQKENRISTLRFALNYAIPLGKQHTIKIVGTSAIRFERGPDIDALSLLYQFRW